MKLVNPEKPFKYRVLTHLVSSPVTPFGVVITDMNLIIQYSNARIRDLLKISDPSKMQRHLSHYIVVNEKQKEVKEIIEEVNKNNFWIGNLILSDTENNSHHFSVSITIIRNNGISTAYYLITLIDLTEQIQLRQSYELQKNYFETLIRTAPIAILLLDSDFRVASTNDQFTEIFGYSQSESIGKPLPALIAGTQFRNETKQLIEKLNNNETVNIDTIRKRRNKSDVDVNITATKIFKDDKSITYILLIRDISQQKKYEKEIIRQKEIAEESDRLKSYFLSQISHEFRTPLNSIMSFSNLLKEILEDKLNKEAQNMFSFIDSGSRRIIRTVELIINASEAQSGAYKPTFHLIDLKSRILEPQFNIFKTEALTKGLDFRYTNHIAEPLAFVDEYSVNETFAHLIDNAIKFTKEGFVEILLYYNKKREITIDIIDSGIGISEKYISCIFDIFSQENAGYSRKYDGLGLGLFLVKKYCELNRAKIEISSTLKEGSTFRVTFSKEGNHLK